MYRRPDKPLFSKLNFPPLTACIPAFSLLLGHCSHLTVPTYGFILSLCEYSKIICMLPALQQ